MRSLPADDIGRVALLPDPERRLTIDEVAALPEAAWQVELDTARAGGGSASAGAYALQPRSLALLSTPRSSGPARTDS